MNWFVGIGIIGMHRFFFFFFFSDGAQINNLLNICQMFIFEKSYTHFDLSDGYFWMGLYVSILLWKILFYFLSFLPSFTTKIWVLLFHSSHLFQMHRVL